MIVELRNIFNNEGEVLTIDSELDMSGVKVGSGRPYAAPIRVRGKIENRSGIVTLFVKSDFIYSAPCDRCCEIVDREMSVRSKHVLVSSLNNEENDKLLLVSDMNLDIDELIRSDILLETPAKVLCSPGCKGICIQCGKNLNEGLCGCKKPVDARLEILKDLLD